MKGDVICKCPKCGGDIVETEKAFGCSNWKDSDGACKMTVWKTIAKREITPDIAKQLIENGQTDDYLEFTSKKNTPFNAKLVFADDKVNFEFEPKA